LLYIFLFIQVANIFDLWATMTLMGRGVVEEANPLVRWIMTLGPDVSYVWKAVVVGAASLILAIAARKTRVGWVAFILAAVGFLILSGVHLYLLALPPL
jgi:hypothetical protein